MSLVLYPPSRPQSIGEVLDSAFRIFGASLFRCLPYGVLAVVASNLTNIYAIAIGRQPHYFRWDDPVSAAVYLLGAFLAMTFFNAILIRQVAIASGSRSEMRSMLVAAFRRAAASVVLLLIALLAVGLCFVPLAGVPLPYRTWGGVVLGVPAIYVAVGLSCAWVALLAGRKGVFASLQYSVHLVRGNWWRTVAIYLVAFAMLAVLITLSGAVAAVLVPFTGTADLAVITAVQRVTAAALSAVGIPFYIAIALALYGDLEARKEGTDLERRIAGAAAG